jgi:pilus assembly protein FimV
MRSTQVVDRPVIDVLIRLTTASGTTSIQSSYLVLANEPSSASRSVRVSRGDTLYAIALSKAVTGADLYQVMWAIYEANPQAFIADNMNLLRAGATLNIPDAATIRAVDAKYARSMFAKHDQAFRARRGLGQTAASPPTVTNASTQSGSVTSPLPAPVAAVSGDQVRLDSTNPADQQADARVASANELREMQSRVDALQKNVEDLKDALHKSQAASGPMGVTGAVGPIGPDGQAGAAGATGATGVAGARGAAGATEVSGGGASADTSGTSGASNTSNTSSASGSPGAQGVAGTSTKDTAQGTGPQAASEMKTGLAKLTQYASDHVLGFVLGISALLALLIAFLLKKAGRNARADELEQVPHRHPGLASAFDQKLQSIDLNLSDDDKSAPASGSNKPGV